MSGSKSGRFLDAAAHLGARVCSQSWWFEDRCNWMGPSVDVSDESSITRGGAVMIKSALGPDVYGGTGGIALFLAHLYRFTGDRQHREHALGAARHASSRVELIPASTALGFHGGLMGVIFALAEVGRILETPSLISRARELFVSLRDSRNHRTFNHDQSFDVMSGSAGAILALLQLTEHFPGLPIMELAVDLGSQLLEEAKREEVGWSWDNDLIDTRADGPNLTGYSHGAAGIGYALLSLYSETRDERFARAAREAIRYENRWYDPERNNWPDFRAPGPSVVVRDGAYAYPVAWCHGAAGIGLSRLKAYEVLGEDEYLSDAKRALARTTDVIDVSLSGSEDLSLCHGTLGCCELLLEATQTLSDRRHLELAERAAGRCIDRYLRSGTSWPCGIEEGETPGLMLGLSGIGYYFLRLHRPDQVQSVLAI